MTSADASALLVGVVREVSATRAERDAWRLIAMGAIQRATELRQELEIIDRRQYTYRQHIERQASIEQREEAAAA